MIKTIYILMNTHTENDNGMVVTSVWPVIASEDQEKLKQEVETRGLATNKYFISSCMVMS